ncbi:RING finger protein unkempt homolog isoform X3 [Rana temporaria]|uniref:RING finger protein unkempt homolog isoform X3 n=1 Tax=Rana temporaria TaxID=8407 RepID=UPI001AAD3A05|nr:RING finger protein unkempt homolog isoform X3 [Rana temporaria]
MSKGPVPTSPSASSASPAAVASGALQAQPEKPQHYTYLKEFRTEQCPLFVQHKCTQHRPYTCFHWHFVNQRRRRSVRRRDGTFNYSPDIYCTKYDETTGLCPEGDDCPFLHRTTGDTERRYHLRYYKTGICIHETDSKGHCTKNGQHCAFAHGPHDLRSPVYDIRELQAMEALQNGQTPLDGSMEGQTAVAASHAMIEKILGEEPRWQDTTYVLGHYKTDQCKKPPRLCRQGYACPYYHNSKDRRRSPRQNKYRSSPCPNVKHADEWGDPSKCESGDSCQYCHTRTEQQFHPEVWGKMSHLPTSPTPASILCASIGSPTHGCGSPSGSLGKPQNLDSLGFHGDLSGSYKKAPGCEREDSTGTDYLKSFKSQAKLKPHPMEHRGQDQSLLQSKQDALGIMPMGSPLTSSISSSITSSLAATPPSPAAISGTPGMNANALPFYPTSDTVESVIESALDDLDLNDFGVAALEKSFDNTTVATSGGIMIGGSLMQSSAPVNIPGSLGSSASFHSTSPSPPVSISSHFMHQTPGAHSQSESTFLSTSTTPGSLGLNGMNNSIWEHFVSGSYSPGTSPAFPSGAGGAELVRLRQELEEASNTIKQWEDSWKQAKQACDAWKKEAEEANERATAASMECELAREQRDALEQQVKKLQEELDRIPGTLDSKLLSSVSELETLPLATLYSIQKQLHASLERVEKAVYQLQSVKCHKCQDQNRAMLQCQHGVICEVCAAEDGDCPNCQLNITTVLQP